MITDVKVNSIDQSVAGTGGRTLTVKRKSEGGFETPSRPYSLPEFIAKSYLGFRGTLDGYLGAVQIDLHGSRLDHFNSINGMYDRTRRTLIKYSDLTSCFDNFVILDVPPVNPLDDRALRIFFELQARSMYLQYMSVPPIITTKLDDFERIISDYSNSAQGFQKGIVPQIALNEAADVFKAKLDLLTRLAETGEIQIINLVYADPDKSIQNYLEVWNHREIRALINVSGVPRSGKEVSPGVFETYQSRILGYGVDTTTPIRETPSSKYVASQLLKPRPTSLDGIDHFKWPIHPASAAINDQTWRSMPTEFIECDCKVCKAKKQDDLIGLYSREPNGLIEPSGMRYASNLHDALSSQNELELVRKMIRSAEMVEYVREKDLIRKEISAISR